MPVSHEHIIAAKAKAILRARESLLAFTLMTKDDYDVNWHHRYCCDMLDKFALGHVKKLMMFMPPQTGKSELSSRRFPAYQLGIDPSCRIALCGYGDTFTQKFNRAVQRIIDTPEYAEIFPETRISSKNVATSSKRSWVRTSNLVEVVESAGFLYTTGVGGPLTGTSVDCGIIDDPVKDRQQAKSNAFKTQVWEWYTDVFKTRLHNQSKQLILMTRWEQDDLAGRILDEEGEVSEGGSWEVIRLEGIREDMSDPNDPRKLGEALWPEKHSLERWMDIKKRTPRTFTSMYQQRPAPQDGDILKREYFEVVSHKSLPKAFYEKTVHFTIDTAYTKSQSNDPSAVLAFVVWKGDLYVVSFWKGRLEFHSLLKKIVQRVNSIGSPNSAVFIEPKASGLSVLQELKRQTTLNVMRHKMITGDKEERVQTLEPYFESGRVKIVEGSWTAGFLQQLMIFPNGKHDEEVDCLVMAVVEGLARGKGRSTAAVRRTLRSM